MGSLFLPVFITISTLSTSPKLRLSKVLTILEGTKVSGSHSININTASLPAGAYFYTIGVNDKTATRKMIIE